MSNTCPTCGARRGDITNFVCYHDWHNTVPNKPELMFSFRLPGPECSKTVSETQLRASIAHVEAHHSGYSDVLILALAAERMIDLARAPNPASVHYTKEPSNVCFKTDGPTKADTERAAETLAQMLKDDLGVSVTPILLRLWLVERWDHVAKLAHKIHNQRKD